MSWREIANICFIRFDRNPSHHSVKPIATSGTLPPVQARRYLPWHQINSPAERRLAVVRLHSEEWSITSIAAYLQVNCKTVYATLQRWANAIQRYGAPEALVWVRQVQALEILWREWATRRRRSLGVGV